MKVHQPLAVISLIALITTFAMTSFAKEDVAVKDTGQALPSRVTACTLTITTPVPLYVDRSLQKIQIATLAPGTYSPLDYKLGWYKIRTKGWIAWIQDNTVGVTGSVIQKSQQPKIASKSTSCPKKN
jgi:hypothetical protein